MLLIILCRILALNIFHLPLAHYCFKQKLRLRFLLLASGVNKISPYSILQIVFAILGGVILFSDIINLKVIIGVILISLWAIFSTYEFNLNIRLKGTK